MKRQQEILQEYGERLARLEAKIDNLEKQQGELLAELKELRKETNTLKVKATMLGMTIAGGLFVVGSFINNLFRKYLAGQ